MERVKGRFLVEFGRGIDMHGGDVNKACRRAVQDAMTHCCMCGIRELLNAPTESISLRVRVGCSQPEAVDAEAIRGMLSFYKAVEVEAVPGGLQTEGIYVPEHGAGSTIEVALASITVCVDTSESGEVDRLE